MAPSASSKPVSEKLLIKSGMTVLFANAPREYRAVIGSVPANVKVVKDAKGFVDVVQVFVTSKRELADQLGRLKKVLGPKGILWVTYPKTTSGVKVDINRDSIREYAATVGLEAIAMVSVDETWSALRLRLGSADAF